MRFFHQAARRAAVLLLCLSMLTGMLIPAFAAVSYTHLTLPTTPYV